MRKEIDLKKYVFRDINQGTDPSKREIGFYPRTGDSKMADEIRHYEVSPAALSGAKKLMAELNAEDQAKDETKQPAADEAINDNTDDKGQEAELDELGEKKEVEEAEASSEIDESKTESADGKDTDAGKEGKADDELSPEEKAIKEQEKLLEEKPVDRDLTPLEERKSWKAARLREKAKIEALERENQRLRGSTPLAAPIALDPQAVEAQISALEERWNSGALPDWDYQRLTDEQLAIRSAAKVLQIHAENQKQAQQTHKRAIMDAAIKTREKDGLIGMRKVFDEIIMPGNPIGADPDLGRLVERTLNSGGIDLIFFLHHHPQISEEILSLPPDEKLMRLGELRAKLTKKRPPIQPSGYRPSRPITNSHIPDKSERAASEDDVQKEISKHLHRFAPHRFQK
jgi:hypothetical protein